MLKRYIGSIQEVSVVIAGKDYGVVNTGDSIPVPDDIAASVSWPETNWEDANPGDPDNEEETN